MESNSNIDEVGVQFFTGYLELPDARVQVDFACHKNATRDEKDLAFLRSLSQIVKVYYTPMGDTPKHGEKVPEPLTESPKEDPKKTSVRVMNGPFAITAAIWQGGRV